MVIYRGGIIDKTKMYDADSRTGLHNISIWVLYSCLLLKRFFRKKVELTNVLLMKSS